MLWQKFKEVLEKAPPTQYNTEGNGVPADVTWQMNSIRKADGTSHCSGATFWGVIEVMKQLTSLQEEAALTPELIRSFIPWAWVYGGYSGGRKQGLPYALHKAGLGLFFEGGTPQEGDVCQCWRPNGSGHLIFCAGYDDDGNLMEWSSSERDARGTGIRRFSGSLSEIYSFRFHQDFF